MIPEKLKEVLKHEGVVSIVTQGSKEVHVINTWNSYIKITDDERLLVPVGGMKTTESNVKQNNKVLVTMGSREVQGLNSKGAGFLLKCTAAFVYKGDNFDVMKQKFSWARAVLEIKPESIKQTI